MRASQTKIALLLVAGIFGGFALGALLPMRRLSKEEIIEKFASIYYATRPYAGARFLGVPSMQYPADNWVMQEIISEIKPDYIVETGTAAGGTTLFYATVLEKVNKQGKVITIDLSSARLDPKVNDFAIWKERVELIKDSSLSPRLVSMLAERLRGSKVLVTLDANHYRGYVQKEMELYAPLVSVGSYLVVQDTHLGGHPNHHESEGRDGGPWEAVAAFLQTNKNFEIDRSREKHLVTQYPSGYLKRIR